MANKAVVGIKVGMTQVWDDDNRVLPVTVLRVSPNRVVSSEERRVGKEVYISVVAVSFKKTSSFSSLDIFHPSTPFLVFFPYTFLPDT